MRGDFADGPQRGGEQRKSGLSSYAAFQNLFTDIRPQKYFQMNAKTCAASWRWFDHCRADGRRLMRRWFLGALALLPLSHSSQQADDGDVASFR
nr:hypothetical protein [uncultured Ottowia sp.]